MSRRFGSSDSASDRAWMLGGAQVESPAVPATTDAARTPSRSVPPVGFRAGSRSRRRPMMPLAVLVGLLASGALVWQGTNAVFSSTTSNPGNSWTTGTVTLADDDNGVALFNVSTLVPGQTATKCITVSYSGNVAANVRLYGANLSETDDLADDLDLVIETGSGATDAACADYVDDPAPAFFTGTLTAFSAASNFGTGLSNWAATQGTSKSYRFTYTLGTDTPANKQGATAGVAFTWESQAGS